MKAEYVVVAEQAHSLGPAYSIPFYDGVTHVIILLDAIILCLLHLVSRALVLALACIATTSLFLAIHSKAEPFSTQARY